LSRFNFIYRNDFFTCLNCGKKNIPLAGSCRNHCTRCLFSCHVDKQTPGDRANDCKGLMKPIALEQSGKKGFIIIHQCQKCQGIQKNKIAPDDDWDMVVKLSTG